MAELDCSNLYGVKRNGAAVMVAPGLPRVYSRDEALNLAAHLAAVADPVGTRFLTLYSAITSREPSEALGDMDGTDARTYDEGHGGGIDLGKPPSGHDIVGEG